MIRPGDNSQRSLRSFRFGNVQRILLPHLDSNTEPLIFQELELDHYIGHVYKRMPGPQNGLVPIIRMFGITKTGNSVCCHVHGFSPYFYVDLPSSFTGEDLAPFKGIIFSKTLRGAHLPQLTGLNAPDIPADILTAVSKYPAISWRCENCPTCNYRNLEGLFEDKIKILLQDISEKFDSLRNEITQSAAKVICDVNTVKQSEINKSYSSALKTEAAIIIKPKNLAQKNVKTKADILNSINPVDNDINISKVKNIKEGGILVGCSSAEEVSKLRSIAKNKLNQNYEIKDVKNLNYRIRIVGMSDKLEESELLEYLKFQNKHLINEKFDCKVLKLWPTKKNVNVYQAILQVDTDFYSKVMTVGEDQCKSKVRCPICGGEHYVKDCTSEISNCVNCRDYANANKTELSVDHAAWDHNCFVYKQKIGDFNIPEYNKINMAPSNRTLALQHFSEFYDMKQFNTVVNFNETILDLVLSNRNCNVNRSLECLLKEDNHHPPLDIYIEIDYSRSELFPCNSTATYNFKRADYPLLYDCLSKTDWLFLTDISDVNVACAAFYSKLTQIFDQYIPKTVPKKPKYPFWYTNNIVRNIKKKAILRKKYKQTKNNDIYDEFKRLRETIKLEIKQSYDNYLLGIQENIRNNPKMLWSYINGKNKCSSIPENITYNNVQYTDPQTIVNVFANFFRTAYTGPNDNNDNIDQSSPVGTNNFSLTVFSELDVLKSLKKIKPKFTKGPDDIPAFIVKDCADVFVVPLTIIFNLALKSQVFPDIWKYSRLCPVFKKDDRGVQQYRINEDVVPFFCKVKAGVLLTGMVPWLCNLRPDGPFFCLLLPSIHLFTFPTLSLSLPDLLMKVRTSLQPRESSSSLLSAPDPKIANLSLLNASHCLIAWRQKRKKPYKN
ncbi:hypothetical protein NQ317_014055 [Molorchus minor]|uniref:DNA polymerase zeta catalytic subunit N-terminal domain-containing protein n=1 Tax=Molorchus minor TaxID=1323400 RepID=A0ABQ9IQZ2_9CUCU|nr:hypothetical protein NQ317_014055 [Molorchus minor]